MILLIIRPCHQCKIKKTNKKKLRKHKSKKLDNHRHHLLQRSPASAWSNPCPPLPQLLSGLAINVWWLVIVLHRDLWRWGIVCRARHVPRRLLASLHWSRKSPPWPGNRQRFHLLQTRVQETSQKFCFAFNKLIINCILRMGGCKLSLWSKQNFEHGLGAFKACLSAFMWPPSFSLNIQPYALYVFSTLVSVYRKLSFTSSLTVISWLGINGVPQSPTISL